MRYFFKYIVLQLELSRQIPVLGRGPAREVQEAVLHGSDCRIGALNYFFPESVSLCYNPLILSLQDKS